MKKLNNKKGFMQIWACETMFRVMAGLMVVAAIATAHSWRRQKAVEFCKAEGYTQYICENHVKTLSDEEVLAYIKDDEVVTREWINRGIFKQGKMIDTDDTALDI